MGSISTPNLTLIHPTKQRAALLPPLKETVDIFTVSRQDSEDLLRNSGNLLMDGEWKEIGLEAMFPFLIVAYRHRTYLFLLLPLVLPFSLSRRPVHHFNRQRENASLNKIGVPP